MQVIRASEGDTEDRSTAAIFTGGSVWGRSLATPGENASDVSVSLVQFAADARTRPHSHSRDQVLYVVSGIGRVGTASGEQVVSAGDCVIVPAGEEHWHGSWDTGSPMTHLTIMPAGTETIVLEGES
jgi:quercetin dioxygenase-like cupin family protein